MLYFREKYFLILEDLQNKEENGLSRKKMSFRFCLVLVSLIILTVTKVTRECCPYGHCHNEL